MILPYKHNIFREAISLHHINNSRPGYFCTFFNRCNAIILYEYPTVKIHLSCLIILVQVGTALSVILRYFVLWCDICVRFTCCRWYIWIDKVTRHINDPAYLFVIYWLINNSYKPITNTAWVGARLCKLQKRVHSTRSRK